MQAAETPAQLDRLMPSAGAQPVALIPKVLKGHGVSAAPTPLDQKAAYLVLIVDDVGHSLASAARVMALPPAVSIAILPDTENAQTLSVQAVSRGHEVLLHMPMEPHNRAAHDAGPMALLLQHSASEMEQRLHTALAGMPQATGLNNHMGSALTENPAAMATVMTVLQERGLFFVDSRTSGRSVAYQSARQNQVPVLGRDVFLDHVRTVPAIVQELNTAIKLAHKNGIAVAIAHPYPETLAVLEAWLPTLHRSHGVRLVSVAQALKLKAALRVQRARLNPPNPE